MEKTSHWAALYFVALMTFGNYVLFNLLVAILVEGFSSERNERREREQRELVKKLREETLAENFSDGNFDDSPSELDDSSSTNESFYEMRNRCRSAEDIRKLQDCAELIIDAKKKMQTQRLLQSTMQDYQIEDKPLGSGARNKLNGKEDNKRHDEEKTGFKKTHSIRERRHETPRPLKMRPYCEPPLITTTAATPQDSPSTTLEMGSSFRSWSQKDNDNDDQSKCPGSPSLLKPPTILSLQRVLDEGIPSIDLIPPSPVLAHKPLNILNASQLGSTTSVNNLVSSGKSQLLPNALSHNLIIDDISKSFGTTEPPGAIYVPTVSSKTAATLKPPLFSSQPDGEDSVAMANRNGNTPTANNSTANERDAKPQRMPSLKRFRRSSSKKNKHSDSGANDEDDQQQLNNSVNDNSCLLSAGTGSTRAHEAALLTPSTPRMSNRTKETNRHSPQNSVRRLSTSLSIGSVGIPASRRASACIFNSQLYQNLNQPPKVYSGAGQRRMSSFELAFSKASNLNLNNMGIAAAYRAHLEHPVISAICPKFVLN